MTGKRIRIGNQTSLAARELMLPFEYAVENGFDAFEWFPDRNRAGVGWEESDVDAGTRQRIGRTAARKGIRLSVHAPWWLDLAQAGALPRLLSSLEFALDMGASVLVVHLNGGGGIGPYVDGLVRFLHRIEQAPIQVAVENTPETGAEAFNELFAHLASAYRLRSVGKAGMCLDLGHANLVSESRNDFLRFMDTLQPYVPVIHIHMHENFGDRDAHLPVFAGPSATDLRGLSGFVERIKRRRFAGSIILEQWPDPPSLLNQAREGLLRMLRADAVGRNRRGGTPSART